MAVSIYIVLHILAVTSHFFSTELPAQLFLFGISIPIIDITLKLSRKQTRMLSNLLKSSCFLIISIINYYTFSYHSLPYKFWLWGIVLVLVSLELTTNFQAIKKRKVRFITYCILALIPFGHSIMSHIELMYFYTLGNPMSSESRPERLTEFAYLHYQQGEKSKAIMYLNKAKDIARNDFIEAKTDKEKLRQTYNTIAKDMLLLLQDKWIIKGKFD